MSAFEINALGQEVGMSLPDWKVPAWPGDTPMVGRHCTVRRVLAELDAPALFQAHALDVEGRQWTYLPYGPFPDVVAYQSWLAQQALTRDPLFFAIVDHCSQQAVGLAAYLRISPEAGTVETGHLQFSPLLQRTVLATEAMYLMMRRVFELGYRRYEWKCNALNQASRQAAERLGFVFEGVFRQATVVKGRNRDTAWYALLDSEWPLAQMALEHWLAPENFDAQGRQKQSLDILRARLAVSTAKV